MQNECPRCKGSGYRSAAADAGMQDMPRVMQPIGVYPCTSCNGSGKMFSFAEQDLVEISRGQMNGFQAPLHSSVRFVAPQCHDMSTLPELQAAYACAAHCGK